MKAPAVVMAVSKAACASAMSLLRSAPGSARVPTSCSRLARGLLWSSVSGYSVGCRSHRCRCCLLVLLVLLALLLALAGPLLPRLGLLVVAVLVVIPLLAS